MHRVCTLFYTHNIKKRQSLHPFLDCLDDDDTKREVQRVFECAKDNKGTNQTDKRLQRDHEERGQDGPQNAENVQNAVHDDTL